MEQFKRAEVIMLPCTNILDSYKSSITKVYEDHGKLYLNKKERGEFITEIGVPQFLYFISDDEIKQGDWYLDISMKSSKYGIHKCDTPRLEKLAKEFKDTFRKIISTTNLSLKIESELDAYYRNGFGGARPFPQPSQQFIEKFIECYNKGEIITHVLVEYENVVKDSYGEIHVQSINDSKQYLNTCKLISSNIKVNPKDNTITIKKVGETLRDIMKKNPDIKEEVKQLLIDCCGEVSCEDGTLVGKGPADLFLWIEQNL